MKGMGGVKDSDVVLKSIQRVATDPSTTVTLSLKLTVASSGGGTVGKSNQLKYYLVCDGTTDLSAIYSKVFSSLFKVKLA